MQNALAGLLNITYCIWWIAWKLLYDVAFLGYEQWISHFSDFSDACVTITRQANLCK